MSWFANPLNHIQFFMAALVLLAIAFSQSRLECLKKWASVVGIVATPYWMWVSAHANRYDIVALAGIGVLVWAGGFYNHWISPPIDPEIFKTGCSD